MKLPENVVIADDKLLQYLLLPREENDKSEFLAIAGYTLDTWEVLKKDLNDPAKAHEIADTVTSLYGTKHELRGVLTGPNRQVLHVVTVRITLTATGETRFVTLLPDKDAAR